MSGFWSVFVIALVVIQMVGALWLLQSLTKNPTEEGEGDTTGHTWDGDLKEYNNQLPRWWLGMFWITAAYMVVYLVVYPGLGDFNGVFGWGQQQQYEEEVAAAEERYGDIFAAFADMSLADMGQDPDAVRLGRNLYLNNCATCHGSDARGARGFPNLTDSDWLYGGEPKTIEMTIANGRIGVMPALGAALGEEGSEQVTQYVLSLSGAEEDQAAAAEGQAKFVQFCSACHGPTGQGVAALGGANLTDGVWLHGGRADDIRDIILNGRVNQMPAQSALLSSERIRTL
ncbi:MAG: cytochrome-c oxidase, cbb3-type subunit III, partial [Gammaproteobacteria bacterium]|nr:cytochrome-c oxidase, cbb3-type subunit III [Gammaproteobacteria bacterium]